MAGIREIVRMPRITRVPLSPEYVLGVANLRGTVTTVLNGTIRLGHPPEPVTERSRVLVLSVGNYSLGFSVDEVRRVLRVPPGQIDLISAEETRTSGGLVSGVIQQDGEPVLRISTQMLAETETRSSGHKTIAAVKNSQASVKAAERSRRVVVVQIGSEEFGIGIDLVSEVVRFVEPNPVPNAPEFLAGLITLRSRVVPVIDLRTLMQRPSLREETLRRTTQLRAEYEKALKTIDQPRVSAAFLQNANRMLAMVGVHSVSARRLLIKNAELLHEVGSSTTQARPVSEARIREIADQLAEIDHAAADDSDRRVLFIETDGARFGVAVDRVTQVLDVPESSVQPPPAIVPQNGIQLEGIARLENPQRLVLLLNLTEMIARNRAIRAHTLRTVDSDATDLIPMANQSSQEKWVSFVVGDEQFAIAIADVVEIGRMDTITRVPSAPKFIRGVINLRGNVIPVIDLRTRFEMTAVAATPQSRMIYIRSGLVTIGLVVDRVLEIIDLPEIEPPPQAVCSKRVTEYLLGIAKHRETVVLLLSSEKFLTESEHERIAETSRKLKNARLRSGDKS
jgi:purine-binding chemotaxis protein CheW